MKVCSCKSLGANIVSCSSNSRLNLIKLVIKYIKIDEIGQISESSNLPNAVDEGLGRRMEAGSLSAGFFLVFLRYYENFRRSPEGDPNFRTGLACFNRPTPIYAY